MDRDPAATLPTRTFLVERYWPGIDEPMARTVLSDLERAARAMTAVRAVNERAEIPMDRIAAAVALRPTQPMEDDR